MHNADDNAPRGQWTLGRVVEVFPGRDEQIRTVEVCAKGTTYKRPVAKLCFLLSEDDT